MAIEFDCPYCGRTLKTADEKAGVQAKCPGCSEVITVPGTPHAPKVSRTPEPPTRPVERDADDSPSPVRDEPVGEFKTCPMCGEKIRAQAAKCRHCGEELRKSKEREFQPTRVEIGPIFNESWEIFQKNVGPCVLLTLVTAGIWLVTQIPGQILQAGVNQGGLDPAIVFVGLMGVWVLQLVATFLIAAGQAICFLKMARGEEVQVGDLFQGGKFFLRSAGSTIVYEILKALGLVLCIVPGVFVMLVFWPYMFVIVDRDEGAMESLGTSRELTKDNLATGFLMGLLFFGLNLAGALACLVGLLFSMPLALLMTAVAYLKMSGQKTAGDLQ